MFTTALFAVDGTSRSVSLAGTKYKTTKTNSRKLKSSQVSSVTSAVVAKFN